MHLCCYMRLCGSFRAGECQSMSDLPCSGEFLGRYGSFYTEISVLKLHCIHVGFVFIFLTIRPSNSNKHRISYQVATLTLFPVPHIFML